MTGAIGSTINPAAGITAGCTERSSAALVAAIRGGDATAEAELCRRYRDAVHRLLVALCRDEHVADDCTNDALVTVLVKLRGDGIDHPDRLASYIFQTARFTMIGHLRKKPRIHLREDMDDVHSEDQTEASAVREEQRHLVNRVIDKLEVARDREVLFRSYICGEPKQNICDALALTTTHFDRVISRARGRLRRAMENEYGDVSEVLAV